MKTACCCSAGFTFSEARRDRESYQPLLRLLRRPFDEIDDLLGNGITESLAKIVTGVFDDDAEGLFALMVDRSIDEFIREALFGAATFLAWEDRIQRERFRQFLVRFHEERLADNGDQAWAGWLQAIMLLGLRDLVPLVDEAWREGRLSEQWIDRSNSMTNLPQPNARLTTSIALRKGTSATSKTCSYRSIGPVAAKTSSKATKSKTHGLISIIPTSRSGIPGGTSGVTIHALAEAARKRRNAALPTASPRCDVASRWH
jgi:uncharacterized protein DUF1186